MRSSVGVPRLTGKVLMTGEMLASRNCERAIWCDRCSPQPGGRLPAPGELVLVQAFINSHFDLEYDRGADLLATPAALMRWLKRRDLLTPGRLLDEVDVRRAVSVRERLRALARANCAEPGHRDYEALAALDAAARGVPIEIRFADGGPRLVPGGGSGLDRAFGLVLGITARAMIDRTWMRLKVCPGEHCGWAFYDHSRNQSGRWCSMAICGGRAKARAHYKRIREKGG